jgi:hypothetical protein
MKRFPLVAAVLVAAGCSSTSGGPAVETLHRPCVSTGAQASMVAPGMSRVMVARGSLVTVALIEPEAYASSAHGAPPRAFPWLRAHSSEAQRLQPARLCRNPPLVSSLPERLYAFRALLPGTYVLRSPLNPAYHPPHMRSRLAPLRRLRVTVVVGESRPPIYTVVAPLLQTHRGGPTMACQTELLSYPPAGCSGVPVSGVDIRHMPGARRVSGVWATRPLRLTGTWDGRTLHVTNVPRIWRRALPPDPPVRCRVPATSFASALSNRIAAHRTGVQVLETSACGGTAWVLVAVDDTHTASVIHHRFGRRVIVSGWLRRVTTAGQ